MKGWQERLRPLDKHYLTMVREIVADLEKLNEDDLRAVIAACGLPSDTNCSWHTYQATPIIKQEAQIILNIKSKRSDWNIPIDA